LQNIWGKVIATITKVSETFAAEVEQTTVNILKLFEEVVAEET
jgi:hypothetical protein